MIKITSNNILSMSKYFQYNRNIKVWHFGEIGCFLLFISSVGMPWLYLEYAFKISGFSDNPLNQDAMMVFPFLSAFKMGILIYSLSIILSLVVAFFGLKRNKLLLLLVVFNVLLSVGIPSIILRTFPKQFQGIVNSAWFDYTFISLFIQSLIIVPLIASIFRIYSICQNRDRNNLIITS